MSESTALAACPFCGGAMQFRKALWPSDGCTDAVIHAEPSDCGMHGFDIGTTDESVIVAWNRRASLAEGKAETAHPRLKETPYGPAILLDDLRDAERYRWLRDHSEPTMDPADNGKPWCARVSGSGLTAYNEPLYGEELDAAIDAAMSPPSMEAASGGER